MISTTIVLLIHNLETNHIWDDAAAVTRCHTLGCGEITPQFIRWHRSTAQHVSGTMQHMNETVNQFSSSISHLFAVHTCLVAIPYLHVDSLIIIYQRFKLEKIPHTEHHSAALFDPFTPQEVFFLSQFGLSTLPHNISMCPNCVESPMQSYLQQPKKQP